ncbi:helix-turn-helix domain-containing protein [Streptomyces sp. NPDC001492]
MPSATAQEVGPWPQHPPQARRRATIVLLAAGGRGWARIAAEIHLHVNTVRRWRSRFAVARRCVRVARCKRVASMMRLRSGSTVRVTSRRGTSGSMSAPMDSRGTRPRSVATSPVSWGAASVEVNSAVSNGPGLLARVRCHGPVGGG